MGQDRQLEAVSLATLCASGQVDASATDWIRRGFETWIRSGGTLTLERCLMLPSSAKRMQLMQRNFWLRRAAEQLDCVSRWRRSNELADRLDRFLTRGQWRQWQACREPPESATDLEQALFYVAKFNAGKGLSYKQIERATGQV